MKPFVLDLTKPAHYKIFLDHAQNKPAKSPAT
jgi:hypothetical protein